MSGVEFISTTFVSLSISSRDFVSLRPNLFSISSVDFGKMKFARSLAIEINFTIIGGDK